MPPKSTTPLFSTAPFFMVRTPVLSTQDFACLCEDHPDFQSRLFGLFENSSHIRESILVASPKLYEALVTLAKSNEDQKKEIASSLLRYLLRMSTRATPFGLFSFVGLGHWGEITQDCFSHDKLHHRARPDMGWLTKVVDQICEDPDHFPLLPVRINPLVIQYAGRIHLNYRDHKSTKNECTNISIKATPLTQAIFRFIGSSSLSLGELEEGLLKEIPSLDRQKTRNVIRELLSHKILLFSLLPSLLVESPYQELLKKIHRLNLPNLTYLEEFVGKLTQLNLAPLGKLENPIKNTFDVAKGIASSEHYLQVDLAIPNLTISLSKRVQDEITKTAEFLWRLSGVIKGFAPNANFKGYLARFLEKYGLNRSIPLMDLLSAQGLGLPDFYRASIPESPDLSNRSAWNQWLTTQWTLCIRGSKEEIILTEELLSRFEKNIDQSKAPLSFDFFCQLVAESGEEIDEGRYKLHFLGATTEGGATFGRFLDILESTAIQEIQEFYHSLERLNSHSCFVETSYIPLSSRLANVVSHPNLRTHRLDLAEVSGDGAVLLQDIYVGASEERFYFTDRDGTKEWVFSANNLLNKAIAPPILRFLMEVSSSRYLPLQSSFWGDFGIAPFFPRIRFNKTIISAAHWYINKKILELQLEGSRDLIRTRLKEWMDLWKLPRLVYLTHGDNRILLDWHSKTHFEEIINQIKKGNTVLLVEKIGQKLGGQWVKSSRGTHFTELVVPCIKNHCSPPSPVLPAYRDISPNLRWKAPGSDWLFIKLYMSTENQEKFLLGHLQSFLSRCLDEGMVKKWFFVRYSKDGFHLRVRMLGESNQISANLIPSLHDWAMSLFHDKSICDIQLCTYEREVARYGGEQLIDAVEEFFYADTEAVLGLLTMAAKKETQLPVWVLAAFALIDLLKGFGYPLECGAPLFFTSRLGLRKDELKGIREWRKVLGSFAEYVINNQANGTGEIGQIQDILLRRTDALQKLSQKMHRLDKLNELSCSMESIQNSIIHMHCNRLLGLDVCLEQRARLYANYAIDLYCSKAAVFTCSRG